MGIEQPRFDTTEEETGRSNVIQGPWPQRERVDAEAPQITIESRGDNVIEGPWPKREQAPQEETPKEPPPLEAEGEKTTEVQRLREELVKMYGKEEQRPQEQGEKTDDDGKRTRFAEGYTEYTRCEVCGGKGRKYFVLKCPACGGRGSIPASSSRRSGYYEVE